MLQVAEQLREAGAQQALAAGFERGGQGEGEGEAEEEGDPPPLGDEEVASRPRAGMSAGEQIQVGDVAELLCGACGELISGGMSLFQCSGCWPRPRWLSRAPWRWLHPRDLLRCLRRRWEGQQGSRGEDVRVGSRSEQPCGVAAKLAE